MAVLDSHRALAKVLPVRSTELFLPTSSHTWQEQAMLKVEGSWAAAMLEGSWAHYSLLQLETEYLLLWDLTPPGYLSLKIINIYAQPKSAAHFNCQRVKTRYCNFITWSRSACLINCDCSWVKPIELNELKAPRFQIFFPLYKPNCVKA